MNMFKLTCLIGLAGISMLSSCQKDLTENGPSVRPLTSQEMKTVESSNDFAFRAFASLSEGEGTKNMLISPLSISSALAMTYNGAGSTTKAAMKEALGFTLATDQEINSSFKSLDDLLKGIDKKVVFTSANSLWHSNAISLQAPFVETNKTYFDATVQGLDFSSPAALDQINNWVSTKTNGKIDKIIDEISREHVLFLINAIYFKGTWTYPFDKELTQPSGFRLEDGTTIQHDFMTMKGGKYLYYRDEHKQLIDLPYGNGQYSMTIIMPEQEQTVQDVIQNLNEVNLNNWLAAADTSKLELRMPKFKMEYGQQLKEMLSQLGMGIAFTQQADFSHMIEGEPGLAISEVKHKTFIEVNEEGTEAAAATSVGIVVTSLPPSIRIDKPFVFMIREKSSNAILFIGKLMQPE